MCRTSQALYVWCQCEEAHMLETCHSGRVSPSGSCDSVATSETVYLQCFCRYHATNGFTSIRKDRKIQKKAEKKKNKRRSMDSVDTMNSSSTTSTSTSTTSSSSATSSMSGEKSPSRLRRSWINLRRLSFAA